MHFSADAEADSGDVVDCFRSILVLVLKQGRSERSTPDARLVLDRPTNPRPTLIGEDSVTWELGWNIAGLRIELPKAIGNTSPRNMIDRLVHMSRKGWEYCEMQVKQ